MVRGGASRWSDSVAASVRSLRRLIVHIGSPAIGTTIVLSSRFGIVGAIFVVAADTWRDWRLRRASSVGAITAFLAPTLYYLLGELATLKHE